MRARPPYRSHAPGLALPLAVLLLTALTPVQAETTLWNADPLTRVWPTNAPPAGKPLGGVRIVAPRGGVGSGQVVARAPGRLSASVGDLVLRGGAGTIPRSAVTVRYATKALDGAYCDVLADAPTAAQPAQPVWITVAVPLSAAPGEYEGRLTVSGRPVPVVLKVCAFRLPALKDRAMWVSMTQSPESVALHYRVAPYSEPHWKLLERSLALQGQLADKVLYLPAIARTWFGNEHGMIPFRREGERLTPDFAIFDRYLALYTKHCGPPRAVVLDLWEPYMNGSSRDPARDALKDKLWLTVISAAGKLETWETAKYPAHEAAWRALLTGVTERLRKAGLRADVLRLGLSSDANTGAEVVDFFRTLAPGVTWATFTHGYGGPAGHLPWTYGEFPDNAVAQSAIRGGWDGPADRVVMNTVRDRHEDGALPVVFRAIPDIAVGVHHGRLSTGLARVGLDCWPIAAGNGRTGRIIGRFPENRTNRLYRHPDWAVTAPGPEGALATQRFEMLREGIQDTEARIVLEKALKAGTLPADLKARAGSVLLARTEFLRAVSERATPPAGLALVEQLLDVAGEVQSQEADR